jgi:hypothetical protein
MKKICFTTMSHHRSIGNVLLFYFKPIQKKVNFISGIENHVGVLFIKRDGVGSTMTLMKLL